MFPRASNTQLLSSSPTIVISLQSSSTAAVPAVTVNQAQGTTGAGLLGVHALLFDGTNFVYLYAANSIGDGVTGARNIGAANYVYDDSNGWNRVRTPNSTAGTNGTQLLAAGVMCYDPSTGFYERASIASAGTLSAATQNRAQLITAIGEWAVNHTPAAGVKATITKAAGAGAIRHVCKSIAFNLAAIGAIAGGVQVNLRDGATGAGTILWSMTLAPGIAGTNIPVTLGDLNIVGSAATAMTLEFSAAPGGADFESVAMTGYSTTT